MSVDPRLIAATEQQLVNLRAALAASHHRVGWKLGMGDAERLGQSPAVGHLTTATRLERGASYAANQAVNLRADAEVAIELNRDIDLDSDAAAALGAIAGFRPALEFVDLGHPASAETVVATNIFHRAVAFGAMRPDLPAEVAGALVVNDDVRDSAPVARALPERLCRAARVLAAVDERLSAGDMIITGSVVQVAVRPCDDVVADFGALGSVRLRVTETTPAEC